MAVRTPYTPLYEDVLDYLERSGLPSVGGIFDDYDQSTNPFITNFDELTNSDKTGINSLTNPLLPIVNDNSGDELALIRRKMLEEQGGYPRGIDYSDPNIQNYKNFIHPTMNQIANDDEDQYLFNAEDHDKFYDPLNIGARQSTMQQIGLKVAEDVRREQIEREKEKEKQRQLEEEIRQQELKERQQKADESREQYNPGNIGGGGYRSDRDNDRDGGYGNTDSKRSEDNRSSDLGFSDIRLKENVELIGKSPSNINIYKFSYKNNPTIYQGAMAHEVPWASVKHSNGYMMVDYNQIDVEFKKI